MKDCVGHLEDIPADEFVVTVNADGDSAFVAVFCDGVVHRKAREHPLFVLDENGAVLFYLVKIEVPVNQFGSPVVRGIVSNNDEVVCVVLQEDRVQVLLAAKVFVVVVAGSDDADRQLGVSADLVLTLHFQVLLFKEFLLLRVFLVVQLESVDRVLDVRKGRICPENVDSLSVVLLTLLQLLSSLV